MQKKLVLVLLIILLTFLTAVPVLAHPKDDYSTDIFSEGVIGKPAYYTQDMTGFEENNLSRSGDDVEEGEDTAKKIDIFEILLREIIKSKDLEETERFLVTFTQPIGNCIAYDSQSFICGFMNHINEESIDSTENINGDPGIPAKVDVLQDNSSNYKDVISATEEIEEIEEIVIVILARYNEKTGEYEECKNTEGESRWCIGSFGLFTKVVDLLKGVNKLKIIVFKRPKGEYGDFLNPETEQVEPTTENFESIEKSDTKAEIDILEAGKNLQITYFTINALNEAEKDELLNKPAKIGNMFIDLFSN